jgi:hypothetical protein
MPKEKSAKKVTNLRHAPLGADIEKPVGKLKAPKQSNGGRNMDDDDFDEEVIPKVIGSKIFHQAREQQMEISESSRRNDDQRGKPAAENTFDSDFEVSWNDY